MWRNSSRRFHWRMRKSGYFQSCHSAHLVETEWIASWGDWNKRMRFLTMQLNGAARMKSISTETIVSIVPIRKRSRKSNRANAILAYCLFVQYYFHFHWGNNYIKNAFTCMKTFTKNILHKYAITIKSRAETRTWKLTKSLLFMYAFSLAILCEIESILLMDALPFRYIRIALGGTIVHWTKYARVHGLKYISLSEWV